MNFTNNFLINVFRDFFKILWKKNTFKELDFFSFQVEVLRNILINVARFFFTNIWKNCFGHLTTIMKLVITYLTFLFGHQFEIFEEKGTQIQTNSTRIFSRIFQEFLQDRILYQSFNHKFHWGNFCVFSRETTERCISAMKFRYFFSIPLPIIPGSLPQVIWLFF